MSDLIAVSFANSADAFAFRSELVQSQREYLISLDDAVVVTRDDGKVKLHQAVNMTAMGAVSGAFWGSLIGLLFLNPLLGAAVGAGSGALGGVLTDVGIDDGTMKEFGETLPEGGAAVFVLVRKASVDKLLARMESFRGKGKVVRSSLSEEQDARIRALLENDGSTAAPAAPAAQDDQTPPPPPSA